ARRGEHVYSRRLAQHGSEQLGDGFDDVLAVVEHEKGVARGEVFGDRVRRCATGLVPDTERRGKSLGDHLRIRDGGELDPGDAVVERGRDTAGGLNGQPGLPAPAGAGKRQQSVRADRGDDLGQHLFTANEGGERRGKRRAALPYDAQRGYLGGSAAIHG